VPAQAGGDDDDYAGGLIAGERDKELGSFLLWRQVAGTAIVRGLRAGSRLVLLDDVGRDPAAFPDFDALLFGPLADLGIVDGAASA